MSVSLAIDGAVARVTLENPKKLNIFTREALKEFFLAFKNISENKNIQAVVVTGSGEKAFVGGADIETLGSLNPKSAREFIGLIHAACAAVRDCPVPVVARINGYCLGAGLELAAACDLRIASENAVFGMPEVRLGIPSVVEAALLPRLVGAGRARWLVMTGETIDARTALSWGLLEFAVPVKELDSKIEKTIDAILAGDPQAIRAQKRLCKLWEEAPLDECIRKSIDEFEKAYESDEPRKRVEAFRAARKK